MFTIFAMIRFQSGKSGQWISIFPSVIGGELPTNSFRMVVTPVRPRRNRTKHIVHIIHSHT